MTFFDKLWTSRKPVIRFSLFKRLVITLFLITIVAGFSGAAWTYYFFQNLILNYAGNVSADAARLVLETFDQKLDEKIFSWRAYFSEKELITFIKNANDNFEKLSDIEATILERDRLWLQKVDLSAEPWYQEILASGEALELNDFATHSNYSEIGHYGIGEIFFANTYGALVVADKPTTDYDQSDEVWWQRAMKDGLFIGPIEWDESTGLHGVTVGMRIDDGNQPLGVVKVFYNLTEAERVMENIINTRMEGAKTSSGLVGGRLIDNNFETIYLLSESQVDNDYLESLEKLKKTGDDYLCCTSLFIHGQEKNVILALANLPQQNGEARISWNLVLEFERDVLLAPLKNLPLLMFSIVLAVCLLLFFYSMLFISPLVNTLVKLENSMAKVVAGDLTVRTNINRTDELGQLAKHFDKMVEQLDEANKTRQEFISTATHGLKAPLTGIKWNLEIIFDDKAQKLPITTKKTLKEIYSTCTQVIGTISDVLKINKMTIINSHNRGEYFDPADFLTSFKPDLEKLAKSRGREIRFVLSGDSLRVFMDKDVFRDIVENLVSNAIKYSDEGKQVEVRLRLIAGQMSLEVEDHGIGIPESEQRNLFQEFYRASNAVGKQIEGSGLGLYIAKSEAKAWGGNLTFISKEGLGSTFMFSLPLK